MKLLNIKTSIKPCNGQYKESKEISLLGIKFKFCTKKYVQGIYNKRFIPKEGLIYKGNPEYGLCSMESRITDTNGKLEFADMINTNRVIGKKWIKKAKKVVNIGAGIGTFEYQNAARHPKTKFIASEFDTSEISWAKKNRPLKNVIWSSETMPNLLKKYNKFDLAVCIDVLEHVVNYKEFLDEFSKLSDKAVFSTPNRDRYVLKDEIITPPYIKHAQEWNAGEIYFILKMYYKNVKIYSLVDDYNSEEIVEVGLYSTYNKLIAFCEK